MFEPYSAAQASAAFLRAHEVLHAEGSDIRELIEARTSTRTILTLYPYELQAYLPALQVGFSNPGSLKIMARLDDLHLTKLQLLYAFEDIAFERNSQQWKEADLFISRPLMRSLAGIEGDRMVTSEESRRLQSIHRVLRNLHGYLFYLNEWHSSVALKRSAQDETSAELGNAKTQVLAELEVKYLNPMLNNFRSVLHATK
jgi:hypothetical protein